MPDLGIQSGKLRPCPDSPNCVSSQSESDAHHIKPLEYKESKAKAQERLLQILETEKRTNLVSVEENYIHAEFTSLLFRFVDDVEFLFPEESETPVIHVRSASRLGYSDLGVNRKRIEHIRKRFTD